MPSLSQTHSTLPAQQKASRGKLKTSLADGKVVPARPNTAAAHLRRVYERLRASYGPQAWWPARTPFEVIVGAYLVQNTSWRGVVRSIVNLEAAGALTVGGLRALSTEQLRLAIRPSGYMVRKAAALQAFAALLDDQYGGSLERMARQPASLLRPQLLALPGVGPETADVILLYALGHPVMVVDEYLRRITVRHGLAPAGTSYGDLQQLALSAFTHDPAEDLLQHCNEFHALIVEAGKNHCGPKPRCAGCPLEGLLPAVQPQNSEPLVAILIA